jgi:predicted  nucleic acid-binding Zn-ribbon protein
MSNTKGTKRNTKKAPVDDLQSDKAQGNTTVAPKTARATKPSVAALQREIEGLKQQLVDKEQQVVRLKVDVQDAWEYYEELANRPLTSIIYQRFTDWLYNVTKNFRE